MLSAMWSWNVRREVLVSATRNPAARIGEKSARMAKRVNARGRSRNSPLETRTTVVDITRLPTHWPERAIDTVYDQATAERQMTSTGIASNRAAPFNARAITKPGTSATVVSAVSIAQPPARAANDANSGW